MCLRNLYGDQPAFASWWIGLCQSIGTRAARRSSELQELDTYRQAQPDWFIQDRLIGYTAYVDRFGGTLQGLACRIPHLKRLGVSVLYLLPFLRGRAGESDGGFAVSCFDQIEPPLATIPEDAMARMALMYGLVFWSGAAPMICMGDELGQVNNSDARDVTRIESDGRWHNARYWMYIDLH